MTGASATERRFRAGSSLEENTHDETSPSCSSSFPRARRGRLCPNRGQNPRAARQGGIQELVQPRGAGETPARHRHAALVLLLGDAKGVRGGGRGGQLLRDRRL